MMLSIEEKERTQCQFASFCKVVFRNAVCSYFRDLGKKYKREVSLEYLCEQTHFEAHSTDDYFIYYDTPTDFIVHGQLVTIDNERLAKALLCLSEKHREIVLLYYFLMLQRLSTCGITGTTTHNGQLSKASGTKTTTQRNEGNER